KLALVARLDVHLAMLELQPLERIVDRELWFLTIFLFDHACGHHTLALDRRRVTGALGGDRRAGLARRGEGVKVRGYPILQHLDEDPLDLIALEFLGMPEASLAQGLVIFATEDLNRAVMVDGAEDVVEFDHTVEEPPGDVALQGSEEGVDVHLMFHRLAGLGREVDVGKIVVAGETEAAELELFVGFHSLPPCTYCCLQTPDSRLQTPEPRPLFPPLANLLPGEHGVLALFGLLEQQGAARGT